MLKKLCLCLSLCIGFLTLHAQETKEDIQKKQQQLLQEIASLNKTLDDIKKNKNQSLVQYNLIQRKLKARQELIYNINKELKKLDDVIFLNNREIYRLKRELDTLKDQYAKSLVFAYKNRSNYDYLNFLFSATSFNDAVKRVTYLRSYRQQRETQVSSILKTQDLLQTQITTLNENKTEKNNSLKDQSKQLTVLQEDKSEQDAIVKNLKSQEKNVAAQIKTKEQTRQKLQVALQTIINREIAAAKKKAEEERLAKLKAQEEEKKKLAAQNQGADDTKTNTAPDNKNTASTGKDLSVNTGLVTTTNSNRTYSPFESTTEDMNLSINFETNKGRLPWPVDQGFVSTHFGAYTVPDTKLKGFMPGLEISLPVGSNVKAVADGEVSAVFDLGNGQTVVLRHGKYFTTYSNISGVTVSKGDKVKPGKILGKAVAGMTGEGQIIFMVTNDKNVNLDPETWLKPRA